MSGLNVAKLAAMALEQGEGIVRLAPNWVPRSFCVPGRRIKLHPDDYYAMGGERGGIDERWFSSTTPADNGPLTSENEGLSFIVLEDGGETKKFLFAEAVQELKSALVGERIWGGHKCWPMYSKFFDNKWALPHHIHHDDAFAGLTGQMGKPEAYYFPPQANNYGAEYPYTFFGLEPGTTKEQVRKCLEDFEKGDNKLTSLSKAYQLDVGTGWDVPPGVLHAPGSMCTYEPQKASDVFAMYESISSGDTVVPRELLWKDTPRDKVGDVDHLLAVIDWDLNVDPSFRDNRFMAPVAVEPVAEMEAKGYIDKWICYKSDAFGAKELTVLPGATVTIKDKGRGYDYEPVEERSDCDVEAFWAG